MPVDASSSTGHRSPDAPPAGPSAGAPAQTTLARLRADAATLERVLDRLDGRAGPSNGIDLRRHARFRYRPGRISIELLRDEPPAHAVEVVTRNLSAGGVGVLLSQFVFAGQRCRLSLPLSQGGAELVRGQVVRCRYLPGPPVLHEAGIRFDTTLVPQLFIPEARSLRVLLVDEDRDNHALLECLLDRPHIEIACAANRIDAAALALARVPDLILMNLDQGGLDPLGTCRDLRRAGFLGPIVGLAVDTGEALASRCAAAGFTGYLARPLTRESLDGLLRSLTPEPLVSTLSGDARAAPLVARFVETLRDRARELALAVERGDGAAVHELARDMRASAGSYGFPTITDEAVRVQVLAADTCDSATLRAAVYDLIHLCLAARAAPASSPAFTQ